MRPRLENVQSLAGHPRGGGGAVEDAVDDLEVETGVDGLRAADERTDEERLVGLVDAILADEEPVEAGETVGQPGRDLRIAPVENEGQEDAQEGRGRRRQDEKASVGRAR